MDKLSTVAPRQHTMFTETPDMKVSTDYMIQAEDSVTDSYFHLHSVYKFQVRLKTDMGQAESPVLMFDPSKPDYVGMWNFLLSSSLSSHLLFLR